MKPKALDLFCGAGGVSVGLVRAGFDVEGVDINPQKNYPFKFHLADALTFDLSGYDFIWASPPCQHYSWSAGKSRNLGRVYPDLIQAVRDKLEESGLPYIVENVVGAPLVNPVTLCGVMFGLGVIRHRLFESSLFLFEPSHVGHVQPYERLSRDGQNRMVKRSRYVSVAGHGGESDTYTLKSWQEAMGIDWMAKEELTQAIPPAYSEYLGRQVIAQCFERAA